MWWCGGGGPCDWWVWAGLLGSVIVVRVVVRELVGRIVPCGAVPAQRCMVQILAGVITRCRGEGLLGLLGLLGSMFFYQLVVQGEIQ